MLLGGIYARLCPEHAKQSGADLIEKKPYILPFPSPALDLYASPGYGALATSLGCPRHCGYCASQILWPSFHERPLGEILADLDAQLAIPGVNDLAIYDDNLLVNREKRFYPLCEHIRKIRPDLRLHTPNGLPVAELDEVCCETLFRTGFVTLRLSLEGVGGLAEQWSGGKAGAESYLRAVRNLRRAGYENDRIETYILTGLPGQNSEETLHAIDFVKTAGGRPKLAEFSPIPGTPLFTEARKLTPAIAEEPLLHNNSVYTQYVAGTLTPDELQALKDRARAAPPLHKNLSL